VPCSFVGGGRVAAERTLRPRYTVKSNTISREVRFHVVVSLSGTGTKLHINIS